MHMQQLHPFWRMEYLEASNQPQMARPFTELPALGDDRAALIVYRSTLSYLMLNRFPYNPGHLLAIPFREVSELERLDSAERADLMDTKVGQGRNKMDPAKVARIGWEAMLDGEGDVVAGMKNKLQVAMAKVTPAGVLAEQHRKMAEPGSAQN